MMEYTYRLEGMHCASCVQKIKATLANHFNVLEVTLNPPRLRLLAETSPKLVELNQHLAKAGDYTAYATVDPVEEKKRWPYYPIFLIATYILIVSCINNITVEGVRWSGLMNHFMAGFFLVFSGFKLLDLRGFADGYATYDLLAKHWYVYGFIYPFLELSLGILYLGAWWPRATAVVTIMLMGFSSLGVIKSLLKKQTIQCACLGTLLNVPLSTITLMEDLLMVILALISLI